MTLERHPALTKTSDRSARMAYPTPNEIPEDVKARLWSRVAIGHPSQCWEWQGSRSTSGYGSIRVNGRQTGAHRLALALHLGRVIRAEECACHHCDNPPCCNPTHLFAGSNADNVRDRDNKGRQVRKPRDEATVRHRRGDGHPQAKLTENDVREMRCRRSQGLSYDKIGREFSIHRTVARRACNGELWSHVK